MGKHNSNSHNYTKAELDNRANQLNPNNSAYWSSRGQDYDTDWDNQEIVKKHILSRTEYQYDAFEDDD